MLKIKIYIDTKINFYTNWIRINNNKNVAFYKGQKVKLYIKRKILFKLKD